MTLAILEFIAVPQGCVVIAQSDTTYAVQNPAGEWASVHPDGTIWWIPDGSHLAQYELATKIPAGLLYVPNQPPGSGFAYVLPAAQVA